MLDIVIVNYKSTDYLIGCLNSIFDAAHGIDVKVWVEDNASTDQVDRVSTRFPSVRLKKHHRNLGFARAVNNGISHGSAPYVLILNPDIIIQEGFFDLALEYMARNADTGVMGPRICNSDGSVQGSARSFPNLLTALFGRRSILTKIFPNNPITRENILTDRSDGVTPIDVDWVSGACMLARRAAIEDVGAMDPRFFMYWEDADWCRRMRQKGWRVVYFPRPAVTHFVGVSSERNLVRSVLEFHRSVYYLFEKHAEKPHSLLKPIIFWALVYRFFFVLGSQAVSKTLPLPRQVHRWKVHGLPQTGYRIKVVRFIARLNIGGPSIHVYLLMRGLDKKRFESILVTGKISTQEGDMSYLFDNFPEARPIIIKQLQREISPLMDLRAFFQILRILARENPDIVHTHTAKAGTSARLAVMMYNRVRAKKIRTVHTFHGHVFEGYFSPLKSLMFIWIERFLARSTDVIVSISRTQKEALSERFHIASDSKIRTIPLGFDLTPFLHGHELKGRFRQSLGLDHDTLIIGIVGRLVPIKCHVMFLDGARIFLDQHPEIKVRLTVVGDGELREELEAYCRRKGLSDHVLFCGWRRDLPLIYADMDILALTSLNEGTPVSIIEAMASSIPVIATDAGGVFDLLGPRDGTPLAYNGFTVCKRGVLCKKEDPEGFAKGLKYLVRLDRVKREALVAEARAFVEEGFSEERLLGDMEDLYTGLMKERRRGWRIVQKPLWQR
ncbi:MAG: glycosyltransferase [Deltaproteobacteria bacterium]|nr:glycosyltransferase [Deltaproteobacteria bacterium]